MLTMKSLLAALLSFVLTAVVIGNAFYQKKQFYPSIVYLTKSNPSMAVIYFQSFTFVIFFGKAMRVIFFGELRPAEFEHLMERSWYAVTETCLAFTVFRDDFSPKFVALFTLLLFLKSFHWLAEDRVDFMERSPVISLLFHVRVLSLLLVLGLLDMMFVCHAYQSMLDNGASVQLVFGFEYAILLTIVANISLKYVLHSVDLHSETPWENKAVFLLYTELVMGFIKMILYVLFVCIMVREYTLPLFAFRPMYYTMRAFRKALNDVRLSRRAIRNMNTLYPDATPEELAAADNVCIICREDMRSASKKLPCNHIFHTACLRSWFQRQQTCPTCRLNILREPSGPGTGGAVRDAEEAARAAAARQAHTVPPTPDAAQAAPAAAPPQPDLNLHFPWIHHFNLPDPSNSAGTSRNGASSSQAGFQIPPFGEFIPEFTPLFPFMILNSPPPMPPLEGLSDEALRVLEKTTREGVEARIKCLQNINRLLDTSVILMQQYCNASKAAAETFPGFSPSDGAASSSSQPSGSGTSTQPSSSSMNAGAKVSNIDFTVPNETQLSGESGSGEASRSTGSVHNGNLISEDPTIKEIRQRRLEKFSQDGKQQS